MIGVTLQLYNHGEAVRRSGACCCCDGTVILRAGTQDIGTGTRTVLAQICAEELGVDLDRISVRIGDTEGPYGPISAGSSTMVAASSGL